MAIADALMTQILKDSVEDLRRSHTKRLIRGLDGQMLDAHDVHVLVLEAQAVREHALEILHGRVNGQVLRMIRAEYRRGINDGALPRIIRSVSQLRAKEPRHECDREAVDVQEADELFVGAVLEALTVRVFLLDIVYEHGNFTASSALLLNGRAQFLVLFVVVGALEVKHGGLDLCLARKVGNGSLKR